MSDERFQHRPAAFKTRLDDQGGLVRVPLTGGPHEGRELYIDEMELPPSIYATRDRAAFEWWPESLQAAMAGTALAGDPAAPPIHYLLVVDDATREPRFVAQPATR
jgi:hypothetical protein